MNHLYVTGRYTFENKKFNQKYQIANKKELKMWLKIMVKFIYGNICIYAL